MEWLIQNQSWLFSALVAAISSIIGYSFREYLNRVRPFISVQSVEGIGYVTHQITEMPDNVVNTLKNASILSSCTDREEMQAIATNLNTANEFQTSGPELIALLDNLISTCDKQSEEFLPLFQRFVRKASWQDYLVECILGNKISQPEIQQSSGIKPKAPLVHYIDTGEKEGSYFIRFPGETLIFGFGLHHLPPVKEVFNLIVTAICNFDYLVIKEIFTSFRNAVDSELRIANEVQPHLKKLKDSNSTWNFELYICNLSGRPFIIQKDALLIIYDGDKKAYEEPCSLLTPAKDESGNWDIRKSPIVVPPQTGLTIAFYSRPQHMMDRGLAIRELFEKKDKNTRFQLKLSVIKVGLLKTSTIITDPWPFQETLSV